MDDTISRQAAIDKLKSIITDREYTSITDEAKERMAREFFADIPSSAQRWTPCSERPPEEGVYFVTFNKSCLLENELPVMDALWRDGQWQYSVLESYEHKMPKLVIEPIEELKVTAWMPFPEPYKEGEV